MNWNKAKTILIIFFICTNLFLLATILISTSKTSIVTDDIINLTTVILKNNRIEIDPAIIPRKTQAVAMIEAKNFIDSYDTFSKKTAGEDAKMLQTNVYEGENGTITFSGDKFDFIPKSPLYTDLTQRLTASNAQQVALTILKKYGFEDNNLIFDTAEQNSEYTVTVTKQKDNLHYFNSELKVKLSMAGVKEISGSWFFEKNILRDKFVLKNVTGVLIDYISVANRPTTDEKITSIELGYSILEEGIHHKEILLTPCWKITIDNGAEYVLSAVENQITQ